MKINLLPAALLTMLSALLPTHAGAAPYSFACQAVDTAGRGAEYATFRLLSLPDSAIVAVGTTDGAGLLRRDLPSAGPYLLALAGIDGSKGSANFTVDSVRPFADLGKIMLMPDDGRQLAEVVVVAQRPLVSREIDRLAYDVQADPEAATTPLLDILRKVPMVSIDGDGNILVNGSSNFKIYKNGRPNSSYSRNAKELFKAIPASSIRKVEVITDPGSREDAEGVAAILNIVTDRSDALRGVTGNASIYMDSNNAVPNPNLWLTTQLDKVNIGVSGGFWNNNRRDSEFTLSNRATYTDSGRRMEQDGRRRTPSQGGWGSLEFSYEPDTLNLFTLEAGLYPYSYRIESTEVTNMYAADGSLLYGYTTEKGHIRPLRELYYDLSANYQRSTSRPDETLTLSYQYSGSAGRDSTSTGFTDFVILPVSYTGTLLGQHTTTQEHTVQADWNRPIAKGMSFAVGAKYIYRLNKVRSWQQFIGDAALDTHDDYRHRSDIGALYADYRLKLGKLSGRAGLRYEYSHFKSRFIAGKGNDYSAHLNDWVPNASVQYTPNDANSFKLSFNRRITRPGIWYLDPTVTEGILSTSSGNPDLHSAVSSNLQFNYGLTKNRLSLNMTATYTFSSDQIIETMEVRNDHNYYSYGNVGRVRKLDLNAYAQITFSPKTSLTAQAAYAHVRNSDPTRNLRLTGNTYSLYLNLTQSLPWKLKLNVYGNLWSGSYMGVHYKTNGLGSPWYGMSLKRSFLKNDALTVTVKATRPGLNTTRYVSYVVNSDYEARTRQSYRHAFNMALNVSYRFGSLSASVKKVDHGISNDDGTRKN